MNLKNHPIYAEQEKLGKRNNPKCLKLFLTSIPLIFEMEDIIYI